MGWGAAWIRVGGSAVAVTALIAACVPSTFDGLTGGEDDAGKRGVFPYNDEAGAPDPSLRKKDPRPISPFSGAWVNATRPKLTWKLQDGSTGATVEVSRTRDFAQSEKFVATGSEYLFTKDLEPGVWFWRLQARSTDAAGVQHEGVTHGPTWSMLVRGRAKNQAKDNLAAHGGIVDFDGNGVPDVIVSLRTHEQLDDTGTKFYDFPNAIGLLGVGGLGQAPAFDPFDDRKLYWTLAGSDAPAYAAGVDIDGDGFGDVLVVDVWPADSPDAEYLAPGGGGLAIPMFGGPPYDPTKPGGGDYTDDDDDLADAGDSFDDNDPYMYRVVTQPFTKIPAVAAGDFNGDGYGDVSAMFTDVAMTMQGSDDGLAFTFFPFESAGTSPPTTFTIASGDFDGDGLSDLGYTPFDPISPIRLSQGNASHYTVASNMTVGSDIALPSRATTATTGDFDGDGLDEVAFATTVGGKAAICVHSLASTTLNAHACWVSDAPVAGFGTTLGSGDTDGDGVDEIFVGSAGGITILSHAGIGYKDDSSVFTPTKVTGPYTSQFTVFYPGRPGKAQWAVYGADGHTLYVVEGKGEASFSQQYDFKSLKQAKNLEIDFVKFGTSIR